MKFISLKWKISGILVLSNLFLGIIITYIVNTTITEALEKELIERGKAIAHDISRYSAAQILEEDVVGLKQVITNLLSFESVQYILIQSSDARIITDTYNGQVPVELTERSVYSDINLIRPQAIELASLGVECYDIIVPVEEGSIGFIRVGMKKSYIEKKVYETTSFILLSVLFITIIGIIIVYFATNKIIRPILYLANRANEISKGKLEEKVQVTTKDEIKYLAEAVERLRESLNMALSRLKKHQSMRI